MKSIVIKVVISILVVIVITFCILLGLEFAKKYHNIIELDNKDTNAQDNAEVIEIKEPETFKGNDRPIAVMIDNNKSAMPQANLSKAYIVYEMIVEGGETRLMALFKGVELDKIGPVRSARHYFIDYALENDAIYVHFGWSPQAQSAISKLSVNNINGIYESTTTFWRVKDKYAPHNAVTNTEQLLKVANRKGYNLTSDQKSVLNYVVDEFDLDSEMQATKITIPYSSYNTVVYEYDEEAKNYIRYSRKIKQVDWDTKEDVRVKNIIITKCRNWTLNDGDNKGRQDLDNVKTLEGYYITNGKAIEITCEKSSRTEQTIYKDKQGNEINVNDGNTFIQICPIESKIVIEPGVSIGDVS